MSWLVVSNSLQLYRMSVREKWLRQGAGTTEFPRSCQSEVVARPAEDYTEIHSKALICTA